MEMEHALIVAKSYFPDAHVVTYKNGDSYYVTGRPPRSITGNPEIDGAIVPDILIVFHEDAEKMDNMCWCPAYKNDKLWYKPVASLSEKEWIRQLKEEMKAVKGYGC